MQRDENFDEELPVFRFQGEGKAIDDATQNLQEFSHTVELLSFVNKPGNDGT